MVPGRRRAVAVAAVVVGTVVLLFTTSAATTLLVPFGIGPLDTALVLFPGASVAAVVVVTAAVVARPLGRRWPPAVAGVGFLALLLGAYGGGRCAHAGGSGSGPSVTFVSCGVSGPLPVLGPCLAVEYQNCVLFLGLGTIAVGALLLGIGLWYTARFDAALARLERHDRESDPPGGAE